MCSSFCMGAWCHRLTRRWWTRAWIRRLNRRAVSGFLLLLKRLGFVEFESPNLKRQSTAFDLGDWRAQPIFKKCNCTLLAGGAEPSDASP